MDHSSATPWGVILAILTVVVAPIVGLVGWIVKQVLDAVLREQREQAKQQTELHQAYIKQMTEAVVFIGRAAAALELVQTQGVARATMCKEHGELIRLLHTDTAVILKRLDEMKAAGAARKDER